MVSTDLGQGKKRYPKTKKVENGILTKYFTQDHLKIPLLKKCEYSV